MADVLAHLFVRSVMAQDLISSEFTTENASALSECGESALLGTIHGRRLSVEWRLRRNTAPVKLFPEHGQVCCSHIVVSHIAHVAFRSAEI